MFQQVHMVCTQCGNKCVCVSVHEKIHNVVIHFSLTSSPARSRFSGFEELPHGTLRLTPGVPIFLDA